MQGSISFPREMTAMTSMLLEKDWGKMWGRGDGQVSSRRTWKMFIQWLPHMGANVLDSCRFLAASFSLTFTFDLASGEAGKGEAENRHQDPQGAGVRGRSTGLANSFISWSVCRSQELYAPLVRTVNHNLIGKCSFLSQSKLRQSVSLQRNMFKAVPVPSRSRT